MTGRKIKSAFSAVAASCVVQYIDNSVGIVSGTKFVLAHVMPLCLSVAHSGSDVFRVSGKSGGPDLSVTIQTYTVRSLETAFAAMLHNVLNGGEGAFVPNEVQVTHLFMY
jgi:hypothetical protein